eukprot:tig00020510_g9872.t1
MSEESKSVSVVEKSQDARSWRHRRGSRSGSASRAALAALVLTIIFAHDAWVAEATRTPVEEPVSFQETLKYYAVRSWLQAAQPTGESNGALEHWSAATRIASSPAPSVDTTSSIECNATHVEPWRRAVACTFHARSCGAPVPAAFDSDVYLRVAVDGRPAEYAPAPAAARGPALDFGLSLWGARREARVEVARFVDGTVVASIVVRVLSDPSAAHSTVRCAATQLYAGESTRCVLVLRTAEGEPALVPEAALRLFSDGGAVEGRFAPFVSVTYFGFEAGQLTGDVRVGVSLPGGAFVTARLAVRHIPDVPLVASPASSTVWLYAPATSPFFVEIRNPSPFPIRWRLLPESIPPWALPSSDAGSLPGYGTLQLRILLVSAFAPRNAPAALALRAEVGVADRPALRVPVDLASLSIMVVDVAAAASNPASMSPSSWPAAAPMPDAVPDSTSTLLCEKTVARPDTLLNCTLALRSCGAPVQADPSSLRVAVISGRNATGNSVWLGPLASHEFFLSVPIGGAANATNATANATVVAERVGFNLTAGRLASFALEMLGMPDQSSSLHCSSTGLWGGETTTCTLQLRRAWAAVAWDGVSLAVTNGEVSGELPPVFSSTSFVFRAGGSQENAVIVVLASGKVVARIAIPVEVLTANDIVVSPRQVGFQVFHLDTQTVLLNVSNPTNFAIDWSADRSVEPLSSWLSVSPSNGTLAPRQSVRINATFASWRAALGLLTPLGAIPVRGVIKAPRATGALAVTLFSVTAESFEARFETEPASLNVTQLRPAARSTRLRVINVKPVSTVVSVGASVPFVSVQPSTVYLPANGSVDLYVTVSSEYQLDDLASAMVDGWRRLANGTELAVFAVPLASEARTPRLEAQNTDFGVLLRARRMSKPVVLRNPYSFAAVAYAVSANSTGRLWPASDRVEAGAALPVEAEVPSASVVLDGPQAVPVKLDLSDADWGWGWGLRKYPMAFNLSVDLQTPQLGVELLSGAVSVLLTQVSQVEMRLTNPLGSPVVAIFARSEPAVSVWPSAVVVPARGQAAATALVRGAGVGVLDGTRLVAVDGEASSSRVPGELRFPARSSG